MGEPAIKAGVINANDGVGLAADGSIEQLMKEASQLEILFEHIGQPDGRMGREVKSQVNPRRSHVRPARAKELGFKGSIEWLIILSVDRLLLPKFLTQSIDQSGGQYIAARFTSDEHERLGFHDRVKALNR